MEVKKLGDNDIHILDDSIVSITKMNNIYEVQYLEKRNNKANIRKIDSDRYLELSTGEIKRIKKTENRSEGLNSLRKTFKRLRELINNNFVGGKNELFVTLTYKGELQTNDTVRIYNDFDKFMKRLRYKFKSETSIDYINVLEPHASGNFHLHTLIRFNDLENVYIPNQDFEKIWGNGFVKIQSLKDVDNIGAYVSAYLADIEVSDDVKEVPGLVEKDVKGQKKKFVKGARLAFYPKGVNIYRKSKGILEPKKELMKYKTFKKKLGNVSPNFKGGIEIRDENSSFENVIITEQYNLNKLYHKSH